ncbi:phosphatidate cytidylyltransferase [Methylophilaceae bacterium]|nr:phosphatidate cytidylyltransferase [Methylophilaceae bacterium]
MLKKRIFSSVILFSIFIISFFEIYIDNSIYFLSLILIAGFVLIYELGKILKLKDFSLVIYWIMSSVPIIFFFSLVLITKNDYLLNIDIRMINMNFDYLSRSDALLLDKFLKQFSVFIGTISTIFWLIIVPLDMYFKNISSNHKFKIFYGYFLISPMIIISAAIFIEQRWALFWLFVFIWIADIGAYFFGKLFGKTKLVETISPGKTVEGALGGLFTNLLLVSFFIFWTIYYDAEIYVRYVILAFIAVIAITALSVIGDIYESFLKRQAGVKDSGRLIPGHGGLLDRLDGFCPTIPLCFMMVVVLNSF